MCVTNVLSKSANMLNYNGSTTSSLFMPIIT